MQQLVLDIEESRYTLLLQFLRTLDYVRVVKTSPDAPIPSTDNAHNPLLNQLSLLQQILEKQSKPLFQKITDPISWQKQQRDEWS